MEGQEIFVYPMSPEHIKTEPESGDEPEVFCRLCNKVFASCVALQNHARIVHTDAFATGDPKEWTEESKTESPKKAAVIITESKPSFYKAQAEKILSRLRPAVVASLAATDVSYIIIKDEPQPARKQKEPRKRKRLNKKEREAKVKKTAAAESEAITGPFECLEESTFGADGTCHQMFFSCCEYSEHQLGEHARPRRRAARCQICERPLLQSHQTDPKDFTCEKCLQGFDTVGELQEHNNLLHAREKKFGCSVCQKKFSAHGGLVQHMRVHTGDRPFACTFCPKTFTQRSGLDQHTRTHTKVKPYRCVICSTRFIQTVHLKQHMRTHTNVMPFQCVICDKRFKQTSHLNYHLKNHPADMTDEQKNKYREIVSNLQRRDQEEKEAREAKAARAKEIKVEETLNESEGTGDEVDETGDEVDGIGNEVDGIGEEVDEADYEVYEAEEEKYPNVIACEVVKYQD